MKTITLDLYFDDEEIAKQLLNTPPPEGIEIQVPSTPLSAGDATLVSQVVVNINIILNIPTALVTVLAAWMFKKFLENPKNRAKKSARINKQEIPLQERDILLFIQQQLAIKDAQEREWCEHEEELRKKQIKR